MSKEARDKHVDKWLEENLTPIGENPLEMASVCKMRASELPPHYFCRDLYTYAIVALDDCDYNGHLSNSSYAKVRE